MEDGVADYQFYATEQTTNQLGWIAEKLPDVSGMDVMFVTKEDLLGIGNDGQLYDLDDILQAQDRLGTIFNRHGLDFENAALDMESIHESAVYESPTSFEVHMDEDNIADMNLIVMDLDRSPEEWMSFFTDMPAEVFHNLPGDTEDYNAFVAFHEAQHARHPIEQYRAMPLVHEADSDRAAMEVYQEAIAEGRDLAPEVMAVMDDIRAVGALGTEGMMGAISAAMNGDFSNIHASHTTHAFVGTGGLPELSAEDMAQEYQAMQMTTSTVNMMVGMDEFKSMIEHYRETGELSEAAAYYFDSPTDMAMGQFDIPKINEIGAEAGLYNPELSYAMLYTLDDAGMFQDPSMAGYVGQVRGFFDKYGPDIVNDEGMKSALERYGNIIEAMEQLASANPENEASSIFGNNDHNTERQQRMDEIEERISMPSSLTPG